MIAALHLVPLITPIPLIGGTLARVAAYGATLYCIVYTTVHVFEECDHSICVRGPAHAHARALASSPPRIGSRARARARRRGLARCSGPSGPARSLVRVALRLGPRVDAIVAAAGSRASDATVVQPTRTPYGWTAWISEGAAGVPEAADGGGIVHVGKSTRGS